MKKFFFSICALAAVAVGCTKSEVLNRPNADTPIVFEPYSGRVPVTKATAADIDTLGEAGFQVYAFMHKAGVDPSYSAPYMNTVVTKDGDNWTYNGNAYWPATNQLDFIAYGLNAGATPVEGDLTKINFTMTDVVADQKDLLVAKTQENQTHTEENDGTLALTFSHLLSRVGFSLVTKASNAIFVTIEQVNLVGKFYAAGQVDLTATKSTTLTLNSEQVTLDRPYITPTGDAAETTYKLLGTAGNFTSAGSADGVAIFDNSMLYTLTDTENKTGDDHTDDAYIAKETPSEAETAQAAANEKNRYMMIIPATKATHEASLKVKYFLPGAGTFEEVTVPVDIDFEAGKSYNFKFKVSTNGISFSVAVEGWDVTGETSTEIQLN